MAKIRTYKIMITYPNTTEQKVVFIDLDLTLFDYTISRQHAAIHALRELPLRTKGKLYNNYSQIVEHWRGFLILGFPNLRRLWNDESLYFLTFLFTTNFFDSQKDDFFKLLDDLEACKTKEEIELLKRLNSALIVSFFDVYHSIQLDSKLKEKVLRAYQKFEEKTSRLEPFPGARDLLSMIVNHKGYQLYIVTEGDAEIQWEKIEKLGFQDLVNSNNLLTTDGLANPKNIMAGFYDIEEKLMPDKMQNYNVQAIQFQLDALRYLRNLFQLFNHKKQRHFYGYALHIVIKRMLGEATVDEFPGISSIEWDTLPSIKIATLGDRYYNDIEPLIDIFSTEMILSIQMLYGKYLSEKPISHYKEPDYSVKQLNSARKILMQDDIWTKKLSISKPKHFYFDPSAEELLEWYACIALTLPQPIYSVAKAIMQDANYTSEQIHTIRDLFTREFSNIDIGPSLEKKLKTILQEVKSKQSKVREKQI